MYTIAANILLVNGTMRVKKTPRQRFRFTSHNSIIDFITHMYNSFTR